MFTGIISNIAAVSKKEKKGGQVHFIFSFLKKEKRIPEIGESLAVNGVCLTVTRASSKEFEADAVRETLSVTTLGFLETGARVNTERCLRQGDAVGGHFVSGHVDGRGRIEKVERSGKNLSLWISAPKKLKKYLLPKGSIAVDGISLTLQEVRGTLFKLAIVPHTLSTTVLLERRKGDLVNLEADRAEYRTGKVKAKSRLSPALLRKQGF